MTRDRADTAAVAIVHILTQWLRDPVLHNELVARLRDEFADIQRQTHDETRPPD
jgi:hypothetical protein